jgi:hypothetical protein
MMAPNSELTCILGKVFILDFCILLHVLYQSYWNNSPFKQLFKVFIYYYYLFIYLLKYIKHIIIIYLSIKIYKT